MIAFRWIAVAEAPTGDVLAGAGIMTANSAHTVDTSEGDTHDKQSPILHESPSGTQDARRSLGLVPTDKRLGCAASRGRWRHGNGYKLQLLALMGWRRHWPRAAVPAQRSGSVSFWLCVRSR